jgi:hypothetical protein
MPNTFVRPDHDEQTVWRLIEREPGEDPIYQYVVETDVGANARDGSTTTYKLYKMYGENGTLLGEGAKLTSVSTFSFTWPTTETQKIRDVEILFALTSLPTHTTCTFEIYDDDVVVHSQDLNEASGQQTIRKLLPLTDTNTLKIKITASTDNTGSETYAYSNLQLYDVKARYVLFPAKII